MKRCFVISPIGEEGSAVRQHADQVYEYIIKPAMSECQINAFRSDHLDKPGRISEQMFEYLHSSDLCIALLTDYNPNVFYELALAQSAQRPVIILIKKGQILPFDISDLRCVYYDLEIPSYVQQTHIQRIVNYIKEFESKGWVVDDTFRRFRGLTVNYLNMDVEVPRALERSALEARDYIQEAVLTWTVENYQSLRDNYRNIRDQRVINREVILRQCVVIHHKQHFKEIIGMVVKFREHDRYDLRYYDPAAKPMPAISVWSFDDTDLYLGSFRVEGLLGADRMLYIHDEQLNRWMSGYWAAVWSGANKLKEGPGVNEDALENIKERLRISDDEYKQIRDGAEKAAEHGKWQNGVLTI
jgi:hypothetical protein